MSAPAVAHQPLVRSPETHSIDCSCGHRGVPWAFPTGAQLEFVRHVAQAAIDTLGIKATADVDFYTQAGDDD